MNIDYNERMLNYYPEIIKGIREFRLLVESESVEIENLNNELAKALANAYIVDADEETLAKWERYLNIQPFPQGEESDELWLEDRRETILARIYNVPKLNTKTIGEIVKIFTGGTCKTYFKDSTIYVDIEPPKDNKHYRFENVEQELKKKVPAHLNFQVSRDYYTWLEVKKDYTNWNDVKETFPTWEDVFLMTSVS
jgi:hypothetical protein